MEEIIKQTKSYKNPGIKLYHLILENFDAPDIEKHWQKIYSFYKKNFAALAEEEKTAGMIGLINRGLKIIKNGNTSFYTTILQLYKFGLEKKVLIQDGTLSESSFKNIAMIGATLGELKWTATFIKKYQRYLPENHDPNVIYIVHAYLSFYKDEFDKCEQWLAKIEQPILREKINFRSMNLRCIYENYCRDKKLESVLFSEIERYQKFLQRKKKEISSYTIADYMNFVYFIKVMGKAVHLPVEKRKKEAIKIRKEFKKRRKAVADFWISKKLDLLEKGSS